MSRSLVCPGLEWIGPTPEIVLSRLESYMTRRWVEENPPKTRDERERALLKARAKLQATITTKALTTKAEQTLASLEKRGYMEREAFCTGRFRSSSAQGCK